MLNISDPNEYFFLDKNKIELRRKNKTLLVFEIRVKYGSIQIQIQIQFKFKFELIRNGKYNDNMMVFKLNDSR